MIEPEKEIELTKIGQETEIPLTEDAVNEDAILELNSIEEPKEVESIIELEKIDDNNLVHEELESINLSENSINPVEDSLETVHDLHEIEEIEHHHFDDIDYSNYSKKDFLDLGSKMLEAMNARTIGISDVKNIDAVLKVVKVAFDESNTQESSAAKIAYIEKNGNEEGFEFKNDNLTIRWESILIQIREKRNSFYQKLEREKEDYFEVKTRLLQKLREIVESEEKGEGKGSWEAFKTLQTDWKNAGNVNSVHNGTLWSTYNALVDRYFDIRSIQNELKDLDRKKNLLAKEGVVIKIEAIAESLKEISLTNALLKRSNELLNEYKGIGPGIREEQDLLWNRLKAAFDVIYNKKRELVSENSTLQADTLNAKKILIETLNEYTAFKSDSINEWNAKTKEINALQERWTAIKGPLPKDQGKDISKDFWAGLKLFFKNKSEFFGGLEKKKEENLKAKEELIAAAAEILAKSDLSPENTNGIIDLQKKWRTIGQVPDKFRDSLYNKFKGICDEYFNLKRNETKAYDKEQDDNLKAKTEICDQIEKDIKEGNVDFGKLSEYKKAFNAVGFVPRKNMADLQARFIKAINAFVKVSSGVDIKDKEKMMLQNEAEVVIGSGIGSKNLEKQELEIKRKIKSLEEEITLTKNNLEFFGYSKNAEKLKAEYQKKVDKAEDELKAYKEKLKLIKTV